jgi:hypothetical protein
MPFFNVKIFKTTMLHWAVAIMLLAGSGPELVIATTTHLVDTLDYRPLLIDDVFNGSYIATGRRGEF